jgi:hypothetical protein
MKSPPIARGSGHLLAQKTILLLRSSIFTDGGESTKLLISIGPAAGFDPEECPASTSPASKMMFAINQSYIHQQWGANSQAVSDSHATADAAVAALQQQNACARKGAGCGRCARSSIAFTDKWPGEWNAAACIL